MTVEIFYRLLRACAELSAAQAALDQQPDRATQPRDYAMAKVIAVFREFEADAKALKEPQAITIRLTPDKR